MRPLRLLGPEELQPRKFASATMRAFRMGPEIHPNRAAYDLYPTPPEATRSLLSAEVFDGPIWELACGQGYISKVLDGRRHCYGVGISPLPALRHLSIIARILLFARHRRGSRCTEIDDGYR